MEPQTAFVLAIQLLALFSIAGALLLYLLCKVRATRPELNELQRGTVLVTSADTALGLQLCTHLASRGCRVFAGMKDAVDSLPAKLLRGWMKMKESSEEPMVGSIVPMQLDVTREDVLRETTEAMGAYMNAGERGIMAVINTAGTVYRGRIENQDVLQWETMLKTNILGSLRVAKAFMGLLRPTRGRLIYLGAGHNSGDGLVAFTASRIAVESCAEELRKELQPYGISVIALDTTGVTAEALYRAPTPYNITEGHDAPTQYSAEVLTSSALSVIEQALWDARPHQRYELAVRNSKFNWSFPCRSSFHFRSDNKTIQRV